MSLERKETPFQSSEDRCDIAKTNNSVFVGENQKASIPSVEARVQNSSSGNSENSKVYVDISETRSWDFPRYSGNVQGNSLNNKDYYEVGKGTALKRKRKKMTFPSLYLVAFLFVTDLPRTVGSEYPGRECCDSAPPPPPHYYTTTPTSPVPPVIRKQFIHTTRIPPPRIPFYDFTATPTGGK